MANTAKTVTATNSANTATTAITAITVNIANKEKTANSVNTVIQKIQPIYLILMDQMGWPYDSLDCLLFLQYKGTAVQIVYNIFIQFVPQAQLSQTKVSVLGTQVL